MSDESMTPRIAERLARAARAAQALSEVLWESLHEELREPSHGQRIVELSERLASVSATVVLLAHGGEPTSAEPTSTAPSSSSAAAERTPAPVSTEPPYPAPPAPRPPARPAREEPVSERASARAPRAAWEPRPAAVIVDERAVEETAPTVPDIAIRDERSDRALGERAPTAWIASIERRLERYARDRLPFAVLLIELTDVERLRHAELPGEVARLTGLVETALANALRPADSLTRESPGRYWLLAPETDAGEARTLAERLAAAVRGAAGHRGTPLQAAIGIAMCPTDGGQATVLAARADIALYAARAAGRPVT